MIIFGLAETPSQVLPNGILNEQSVTRAPDALSSFNLRNSSRFRSFSVNTQPKYGDTGDNNSNFASFQSGALTPSAAAALGAEYEAVQEKVRLHNQAVQAFAVNASAARPRARTAGMVETPQRSLRHLARNNGQGLSPTLVNAAGQHVGLDTDFSEAMNGLSLGEGGMPVLDSYEDVDMQVSRSLWIGSIPNSTTMSSLNAIFNNYGPIESTRVLTHKKLWIREFRKY